MKRKSEVSQSQQLALGFSEEQAVNPKRRFTDRVVVKAIKGKTKKQLLDEAIAEAVGAGKELHLASVDFNDPNRPKTCLEVDFPILPINHVAAIEGNAGKPIYQMSKWWARRRSSVFRAMLIAAAAKAPDDPSEAAKLVWDSYYGNHQKNEEFQRLKVVDIFMGGGTTLVEGARLGMNMLGNDLNPVAWFVVSNELNQIDRNDVSSILEDVEAKVRPHIIPYFACDCPRGHKGSWSRSGEASAADFSPLSVEPKERSQYQYQGPEIIYTFWAKHLPCSSTGCSHRTPIISSPVVALKTISVKAWMGYKCKKCDYTFDIEQHNARIAPSANFVRGLDVVPFSELDDEGAFECPQCKCKTIDLKAKHTGESISLGKAKNKSVDLTLLIHPRWLAGSTGTDQHGLPMGGSTDDDAQSTRRWLEHRCSNLSLIEVRGALPETISVENWEGTIYTDDKGGNVPSKASVACREATCGRVQDVLGAVEAFQKTAPAAPYMIQGYCKVCDELGLPYGGRFFDVAKAEPIACALDEWELESNTSFAGLWPETNVQLGLETSVRTPLQKYNYKRWVDFFNPRQLVVICSILKELTQLRSSNEQAWMLSLAAFQQYLRNQNMFCIWDISRDCMAPFLSKNNLHPPNRPVENGVFNRLGRGNWQSCGDAVHDAIDWLADPWEVVPADRLKATHNSLFEGINGKSAKVFTSDPVMPGTIITCGSSTSLTHIGSESVDLVITDPPFGDIMQYSELSSFFYVWLRPVFNNGKSNYFESELPPSALEAVENSQRHGKQSSDFYNKALTECWLEASRILRASGILAFTFHHDKDGPWVAVLESLFKAGFYLEAAFPIRSDETKGEGGTPGTFGAQKVEFDIIHVCRKRIEDAKEISWARLRRQILQDVKQLQDVLEHHQQAGLAEADLQVIRRGKALEYYSKHYGKVYVEKGREFTVKEALAGINQLLDDQRDTNAEVPPIDAEPYTRQFLRLFADAASLPRDQMQKYLRGTGVSPAEFVERGWCLEKSKIFTMTPPIEQAQKWKGTPRKGLGKDLDQTMFLIGACYENSGINVNDTLNNQNFIPHPALGDILDWFCRHGGDDTMKGAAQTARSIFRKWVANNEPKIKQVQQTLFDLEGYDK